MSISRTVLRERPKFASGQRDRYVTIEYLASSEPGATRFPVETWETLGTEWMRRSEARANEREAANQEVASTETVWEMAYRADMDPDLVNVPVGRRLQFQGRTYDITAASTIGASRGIELLTIARTDRVGETPVPSSWVQAGWVQGDLVL
jgi:head-tail adaptor